MKTKTKPKRRKVVVLSVGTEVCFPVKEPGFSGRWMAISGRIITMDADCAAVWHLNRKEMSFVPSQSIFADFAQAEQCANELAGT